MSNIHAHDVMQMMLDKACAFSKETLEKAIIEHFGAEARFRSCSAEGMTAAEVVSFLESRGKFIDQDGGFNTALSKICQH